MKIGKRGKINIKANQKLKKLFAEKEITRCEICGSDFGLTFAHRKKRWQYYHRPDDLWNFKEVLVLCVNCHQKLEQSREKTKYIFKLLRG